MAQYEVAYKHAETNENSLDLIHDQSVQMEICFHRDHSIKQTLSLSSPKKVSSGKKRKEFDFMVWSRLIQIFDLDLKEGCFRSRFAVCLWTIGY